jgi:BirA family biotin operon repressor/biotin-[acetyl-CoA-carboxylase] ligase
VVGAARAQGAVNAELKWPNDVLVDERKLSGILCEVRPDGRVIVGIGLNVDYSTGGLPSEEATSLAEFGEVSRQSIDAFLATAVSSVREFVETPAPEALTLAKCRVEDVLATLGREVSVHDLEGSVWKGVAHALTDDGHLVVRESVSGDERIVVASDVRHLRQ